MPQGLKTTAQARRADAEANADADADAEQSSAYVLPRLRI